MSVDYSDLRARIREHETDNRRWQLFALGGAAGIYAWLLSRGLDLSSLVALWIPFVLMVYGCFANFRNNTGIHELADFALKIERQAGWRGWQSHLGEREREPRSWLSFWNAPRRWSIFWFMGVTATLAVAAAVTVAANWPGVVASRMPGVYDLVIRLARTHC
jgi:hypothetical protein